MHRLTVRSGNKNSPLLSSYTLYCICCAQKRYQMKRQKGEQGEQPRHQGTYSPVQCKVLTEHTLT